MAKEEGRLFIFLVLALVVGFLLIVCVVLPFITVVVTGAGYSRIYWSSGLTIASGDPRFGVAGYSLVYLIPIGGIISLLSASFALVPRMRRKASAVGIIVLMGGLFALYGGAMTYLRLSPLFGTSFNMIFEVVTTTLGIGLLGALILGTAEVVTAAMTILHRPS
jgi:hypothetical protein